MNVPSRVALALSVLAICGGPAAAQLGCPSSACITSGDGQAYRLVYQTVYDQQEVTAYRIEYETVCEEQQVTTYRPVWETCERQECYTVRRPVYETAYRTECETVMRPVTTCRTEYVDQGCYAEQMVFKPSLPKTRLRWVSGGSTIDPATGAPVYQPPGLYWEQTPRGTYEVQRIWQPNVVARQVPQTTYVPQTVSRQVPVQVCRYQQEQVCRAVPYRVCRMETVQETVRVPRCVEKRIPITYTCRVPRVVCYRVAVDPCGVPLQDYPPATVTAPLVEKQPTPAAKQNGEAGKTPALGPGEGEPQPLTEPKVEMPEKADSESRTPAPSSDVFGPKKDAST